MNYTNLMNRCLELAKQGRLMVRPNPLVGAVIIKDDIVIAEGFHKGYGEKHAEREAIEALSDKALLKDATLIVNLEPCSHQGKNPPCSELIIQNGFKRIILGARDTNPKVDGKGIESLKNAGVEVITGIEEQKCRALNRRFFTFHEKKRPYVILKWAETADGFIAKENFESKWISGPESRKLVHRWRCEEASVLIGARTALHDNPCLTARDVSFDSGTFKQPLRLLIDKGSNISPACNLFNNEAETLIFCQQNKNSDQRYIEIDFSGDVIQQILETLSKRAITSLIVEGGSETINSFIKRNLWDEARVFISPDVFKSGIKAPKIASMPQLKTTIEKDELLIFTNHNFEEINDIF